MTRNKTVFQPGDRVAAKQKLHQEDFVEQLLVEFVAEWPAIHEATS